MQRNRLIGLALVLLLAGSLTAFAGYAADDIDSKDGIVKLGDRVVFFTDDDNDGRFEKNLAFVIDDVNTVARLNGTAILPGHLVNLRVLRSEDSLVASQRAGFPPRPVEYNVRATRGRVVGGYEALSTSNR